ncbi:MAG: hypothetical protein ACRD38_02810 [Nitrososphaerales archaeon]
MAKWHISLPNKITIVHKYHTYGLILGKALYDGKVDIMHAKEIAK